MGFFISSFCLPFLAREPRRSGRRAGFGPRGDALCQLLFHSIPLWVYSLVYFSALLWMGVWVLSHEEPSHVVLPSRFIATADDLSPVPSLSLAVAIRARHFFCQYSAPRSDHVVLFAHFSGEGRAETQSSDRKTQSLR